MINDDDEIIEIPRSRLQELGEAIRLLGDLLDEERKSHEDIVASMRETVNSVFAKKPRAYPGGAPAAPRGDAPGDGSAPAGRARERYG